MKFWTYDFAKICFANLFLTTAIYLILPILPFYLVDKFSVSLTTAGAVMAVSSFTLYLLGPLFSYLVDTYKRKTVCLLSLLCVIAILAGYFYVASWIGVFIFRLMQGALSGVAYMSMGSTLAVDITHTSHRSRANTCYARFSRMGMALGPATGLFAWYYFGIEAIVYLICLFGFAGLLLVSLIRVQFRAPIGVSLFSFDRFFLPRGTLLAINFLLIGFSFGLIFVTMQSFAFYLLLAVGFILAMITNSLVFAEADTKASIVSGMILLGASFALLCAHSNDTALRTAAVLMGLGIGMVSYHFLFMFVKLSEHCQRGTANTMYLFSWETGVGMGLATACYLIDSNAFPVYYVGILGVIAALVLYLGITNKYYLSHKVR